MQFYFAFSMLRWAVTELHFETSLLWGLDCLGGFVGLLYFFPLVLRLEKVVMGGGLGIL